MKKVAVEVSEIIEINSQVKRFSFVRLDGKPMLPFSGGAHIVVEMNDHGTKRLNAYSLMGSPQDLSSYSISVRRNDEGRGGSRYMHDHVEQGMEMLIGNPGNLFALNLQARKHLFIASGNWYYALFSSDEAIIGQKREFWICTMPVHSEEFRSLISMEFPPQYPKNFIQSVAGEKQPKKSIFTLFVKRHHPLGSP